MSLKVMKVVFIGGRKRRGIVGIMHRKQFIFVLTIIFLVGGNIKLLFEPNYLLIKSNSLRVEATNKLIASNGLLFALA